MEEAPSENEYKIVPPMSALSRAARACWGLEKDVARAVEAARVGWATRTARRLGRWGG